MRIEELRATIYRCMGEISRLEAAAMAGLCNPEGAFALYNQKIEESCAETPRAGRG